MKDINIKCFDTQHEHGERNRQCVKSKPFMAHIDEEIQNPDVTPETKKNIFLNLFTNKAWVPKWLLIDLFSDSEPGPEPPGPEPPGPDPYKPENNKVVYKATSQLSNATGLFMKSLNPDPPSREASAETWPGEEATFISHEYDETTQTGIFNYEEDIICLNKAAFQRKTEIQEMYFGESVKYFRNSIFQNCTSLITIRIYADVFQFRSSNFSGSSLRHLYITNISDINNFRPPYVTGTTDYTYSTFNKITNEDNKLTIHVKDESMVNALIEQHGSGILTAMRSGGANTQLEIMAGDDGYSVVLG